MIPVKSSQSYLTGLQPDEIPAYWDLLVPLIDKVLDQMNLEKYHSADDVLWKCVHKKWQCWIAWSNDRIDCVFITYMMDHPSGWKTFVPYMVGGSKMEQWFDLVWNTFKAYAKEHGCDEIDGLGRVGWLPLLKRRGESVEIEKVYKFGMRI